MNRKIDAVGMKFGRLTVIREEGKKVYCRCECGDERDFWRTNVFAGYSNSCGCLHKERSIKANTIHGGTGTKLYGCWKGMHKRCYSKNSTQYPWYGAKGIKVCDRWHTFANFKEDMEAGYTPGLTLDRIDSNDDYRLDNCRWLTKSQNASWRFRSGT